AQVRVRKNVGNDAHCLGAIRVAAVHERSPSRPPTTMSAWRSMRRLVEYRRGSVPRPLTICAPNVESVSGCKADQGSRNTSVYVLERPFLRRTISALRSLLWNSFVLGT